MFVRVRPQTGPPPPDVVTISQAAREVGVFYTKAFRLVREAKLPCWKGEKLLVRSADLQDLVDRFPTNQVLFPEPGPVPDYGRRGVGNFCGNAPRPAEPTEALPGTPAKVQVMVSRALHHLSLWHERDARRCTFRELPGADELLALIFAVPGQKKGGR